MPGRKKDEEEDDLGELPELDAPEDDAPLDLEEDEPLGSDLGDWTAPEDTDLALVPDDDGGTDLPSLDAPEDEEVELELTDDEHDEPVVIAWSGVAHVETLSLHVPYVCDVTTPVTVLTLRDAPDTSRLEVTLSAGAFSATGLLEVAAGAATHLRLGRDWLAGRALVRP